MKLIYIVLLGSIMLTVNSSAQSISCSELHDVVTTKSYYKDVVNCFGSSMLVKATRYEYEGVGFVVALIKQGKYDFKGTTYIFCGISSYAWSNFKGKGMTDSWGEAFHQYIMDRTCDCY